MSTIGEYPCQEFYMKVKQVVGGLSLKAKKIMEVAGICSYESLDNDLIRDELDFVHVLKCRVQKAKGRDFEHLKDVFAGKDPQAYQLDLRLKLELARIHFVCKGHKDFKAMNVETPRQRHEEEKRSEQRKIHPILRKSSSQSSDEGFEHLF